MCGVFDKCAWGHFALVFIQRLHQMSKHMHTTTNIGILSTPNKPQIYENISMSLYDSLVVTKLVYHKAYMQRATRILYTIDIDMYVKKLTL